MGAVYFYHLTDSSAEAALMQLLPRAVGAGWRVELRGQDGARAKALDAALWRGPKDGFLAHGLAGGTHDALQPVLLTTGGMSDAEAAAIDCVMAVDGAQITADEAARLQRTCILFDGHDQAAVEAARGQWRYLTGKKISAQYWAQEGGRWEKRAES